MYYLLLYRSYFFFFRGCGSVYNRGDFSRSFVCWQDVCRAHEKPLLRTIFVCAQKHDQKSRQLLLGLSTIFCEVILSVEKKIICPHFGTCSGCLLNENVDAPPVFSEILRFFSERNVADVPRIFGHATGWRCRAKLAVRGTAENLEIGLYKEGSHDVVDIPFCQVHHPLINQGVDKIRALIRSEKIIPYNEQTHKGELRYIQCVVERKSGRLQVVFVCHARNENDPEAQKLRAALKKFEEESHFFHSIWLNFNVRRDNVIFGKEWKLLAGEPLLWEDFAGTNVCFQPSSFAQANLDLFETMLGAIGRYVPQNSTVAEYYAGIGVIGLSLVGKCLGVRCCEINPYSEFCFQESQKKLAENVRDRITYHVGSSVSLINLMKDVDIVIVDPPRKGLDRPLLQAVENDKRLKKIIYVSCGWPSFQRDCDVLLQAGWKVTAAEAYVFFPGSNHIEMLVVFERK